MYNRINSTDQKIKRIFDGGLGIGVVYGINIDGEHNDANVESIPLTKEELQNFLCVVLPKLFETDDFIHNSTQTISILISWEVMLEVFKNRFKLTAPDNLYELWRSYKSNMSVYMTEKITDKKGDKTKSVNMDTLQTVFIVDASLDPLTKKDALFKRKVVEYTLKRLAKIAEITDSSTVVVKQETVVDRMYQTELKSYKNIDYHLVSIINSRAKLFSLLPLWKENTIVELFSTTKTPTRKKV